MSVLVDTSVWSLALRRHYSHLNQTEKAAVFRCRDLILAGEAALIGPILQESLSGIKSRVMFEVVRQRLDKIDNLALNADCFILAAEFFNTCRARGISPDAIDMTICAAAHLHGTPIYSLDPDFSRYVKELPIALLKT